MPLFTITVQTYNRHEMLRTVLTSLAGQTFRDFQLIVIDNGSAPSAEPVVEEFRGSFAGQDLQFIRYESNLHPAEPGERNFDKIEGDYHLALADDDVLLPHTLAKVAEIVRTHPGMGFVTGGYAWYSYETHRSTWRPFARPEDWTQELLEIPGKNVTLHRLAEIGLGPKLKLAAPPAIRFSCCFLSTRAMRRVRKLQGEIVLKPHGEAYFFSSAYHAGTLGYLKTPLAVIGEHAGQDVHRIATLRREKYQKENYRFRFSPLKGLTWANMVFDHYLTLYHCNGVAADYPLSPGPNIFLQHLSQVLRTRPLTRQTFIDAAEVLPHLARSVASHFEWDGFRRVLAAHLRAAAPGPPDEALDPDRYDSILDLARAIDGYTARPVRSAEGSIPPAVAAALSPAPVPAAS